jgi:hypothetical protein
MMGSAAFLFPAGLILPRTGDPPFTRKLSDIVGRTIPDVGVRRQENLLDTQASHGDFRQITPRLTR